MGNSCTREKEKELDFGFDFNNVEFSDRTLRLEIIQSQEDDSESKSEIIPSQDDDHDSESSSNFKVETFHIHSLLLAARSPFFHKLFNNGMKESQGKDEITVRITAPEKAAFMDLLSYMYDKPLNATSSVELLNVLIAADKFEVTSCIRHCIQLLGKLPMTVESAVLCLELPSMVFVAEDVKPLINQVKEYVASHFRDFTESQQAAAMDLPLSAVEAVLGSDGLRVDSEGVLFDFVLKWARANYPELEERKEILTNRLAPFICFPNMSCTKLKSILGCPDFDLSELVVNALSSKIEAPYGKHLVCTCFPRRVYNHRLIKVVPLEFARPRCAVYLNLNKRDCADMFPAKSLCSQAFYLGGHPMYLVAECTEEQPTFGLYVEAASDSGSCSLDFEVAVMKKSSQEFTRQRKHNNCKVTILGMGMADLFGTPWTDFMSEKSEYFIDGILHLRVDLTLAN